MIAIVQPHIPHYREEFWNGISNIYKSDIYVYNNPLDVKSLKFQEGNVKTKLIKNILIKRRILFYSLRPLLNKKYDTLILPLEFAHVSTWILLFTKFIHRKKIVLMGQGISVKRYLKESNKPNILIKYMIKFADVIWLYMEKEKQQWLSYFPDKNIIALNNTISGVDRIVNVNVQHNEVQNIKQKHGIFQEIVFIYCARFDTPNRRIDILVDIIKTIDPKKFGFIIIGDGAFKPNFDSYSNIYNFGSVYDIKVKDELFSISNIYLQPAWLGLSLVEAMAYNKPIFTLARDSDQIMQGVELSYIKNGINGYVFTTVDDCIKKIENLSMDEITELGKCARRYVHENLSMSDMINNAVDSLKR